MRFLKRFSIFLMAILFWSADIHAQKNSRGDSRVYRLNAGGGVVQATSLKQIRIHLRIAYVSKSRVRKTSTKKPTVQPQTHMTRIGPNVGHAEDNRNGIQHRRGGLGNYEQGGFEIPVYEPWGGGKGDRYCFILDMSGSMRQNGRFNDVRTEMGNILNALHPKKEFLIFYFSSGPHKVMPGGKFVKATPGNVQKVIDWHWKLNAGGRTNPESAIAAAFAQKPSTIWLLTDGGFNGGANPVTQIAALNASKFVKVNTVAFHAKGGEKALKQISGENGGTYKFVEPMNSKPPGTSQPATPDSPTKP
jgi:hypothetical protein